MSIVTCFLTRGNDICYTGCARRLFSAAVVRAETARELFAQRHWAWSTSEFRRLLCDCRSCGAHGEFELAALARRALAATTAAVVRRPHKPVRPPTPPGQRAAAASSTSSSDGAAHTVLLVGNPGVGKSTLLNTLVGRTEFAAGVVIGQGLTAELRRITHNGVAYVDTPGLSDVVRRKAAGNAISSALKSGNGDFKLFFVVTLEAGKVRPADVQTVREVLRSIGSPGPVRFGLVINKVSSPLRAALERDNDAGMREVERHFSVDGHKVASTVLVARDAELEDDETHALSGASADAIRRFVDRFDVAHFAAERVTSVVDDLAANLEALRLREAAKEAEARRAHRAEVVRQERIREAEIRRREVEQREREEQLERERREYEYQRQWAEQQWQQAHMFSTVFAHDIYDDDDDDVFGYGAVTCLNCTRGHGCRWSGRPGHY